MATDPISGGEQLASDILAEGVKIQDAVNTPEMKQAAEAVLAEADRAKVVELCQIFAANPGDPDALNQLRKLIAT